MELMPFLVIDHFWPNLPYPAFFAARGLELLVNYEMQALLNLMN